MNKDKEERSNFSSGALALINTFLLAVCAGMVVYWVFADREKGQRGDDGISVSVAGMAQPYRNTAEPEFVAYGTGARGTSVQLLYFWAEWCGPCRKQGPVVDAAALRYRNRVSVKKVDIEEDPDLAKEYRIEGVPCVVLLYNGKEFSRFYGATGSDRLFATLDAALNTKKGIPSAYE